MQNQLQSFLKGVDKAACQWFGQYGGALDSIGLALAVAPEPLSTKVGVGLMLANAAAEQGCDYDPNNTAGGTPVPGIKGCAETDGGAALICYYGDGGIAGIPLPAEAGCKEIIAVTPGTNPDGSPNLKIDVRYVTGTQGYLYYPNYRPEDGAYVALDPQGDVSCVKDEDTTKPRLTPEDLPPVTYTDENNGCEMNITFKGYAEGPAGSLYQIQQIEPAATLRSDGGVIGGCFFNPTIVVRKVGGGGGGGGGDEPPITIPVPSPTPPPGDNWWEPYVKAALGGIVAGATEELLENLLAGKYPGLIYRMVSVCEKDASGEPISEQVEVPIPDLPAPDAQLARLDAIVELLQASKNFKQPICGNERPKLEGDWVTLRFESDEPSPNSNRVIRKLLRYRSKSGAELGSITDYWRGFTWTTGPVIVTHADAWWGQPKCWAVSADEGKRVLRHAAGEAGIDPDQVGRWIISGSRDPRYGVSLPVKFADLDGGPWVTQRDGPSGPALINR